MRSHAVLGAALVFAARGALAQPVAAPPADGAVAPAPPVTAGPTASPGVAPAPPPAEGPPPAAAPVAPPPSAGAPVASAAPANPPIAPAPAAVPPAPVNDVPAPVFAAPPPAPVPAAAPPSSTGAVELGAGLSAGGHFSRDGAGLGRDEALDSSFALSAWLGSRTALYGLGLERLGLGKDHAGSLDGNSLTATYLVDTLWLAGRWYFSETRPAVFLGLAAGPALPRVRATGTRVPADTFVAPLDTYSCARAGRVGGAAALSGGGEFDLSPSWSLLTEARASAHFTTRETTAFSGCAPGIGPALEGVIRMGVSYRFGG